MDPELVSDLNALDKTFRFENLNIKNRLLSIHKDHEFFHIVRRRFPDLEVYPNRRCGLWYVEPKEYDQSVYFKSTDGHTNNWGFSIRRLNFQLLQGNGIIVDSTRRGKLYPDSLSKTIPIWCCMLNKVWDQNTTFEKELVVDQFSVSNLERELILNKLDSVYDSLRPYLKTSLSRETLQVNGMKKKLKPVFIHPGTNLSFIESQLSKFEDDYHPIICLTTSKMVKDGEDKSMGFSYVQGAGDDHELWSLGLTPELFWNNQSQLSYLELINKTNEKVIDLVKNIVKKWDAYSCGQAQSKIWKDLWKVNDNLSFGVVEPNTIIKDNLPTHPFDMVVVLEGSVKNECNNVHIFNLESNSKKSSKQLRVELPKIMTLIEPVLKSSGNVLILCQSGTDLSPCIVLCCLCLNKDNITKVSIRQDLIKLIEINSDVNPNRASLNSVNSYLMK